MNTTTSFDVNPTTGKADSGPAVKACSCGEVGRYPLGSTHTALCHNPACDVIAYHTSRPDVPPVLTTRCGTCGDRVMTS